MCLSLLYSLYQLYYNISYHIICTAPLKDGSTALTIAEQVGFNSVVAYLKSVGAINPVGAAAVSASASAATPPIPPPTVGATSTMMQDLPGGAGTSGATTAAGASIDELPMTPTLLSRQTSSNEQLKATVSTPETFVLHRRIRAIQRIHHGAPWDIYWICRARINQKYSMILI